MSRFIRPCCRLLFVLMFAFIILGNQEYRTEYLPYVFYYFINCWKCWLFCRIHIFALRSKFLLTFVIMFWCLNLLNVKPIFSFNYTIFIIFLEYTIDLITWRISKVNFLENKTSYEKKFILRFLFIFLHRIIPFSFYH